MKLKIKSGNAESSEHHVSAYSHPVDLSQIRTCMMGLTVHRWLTGVAAGLGLPQPPHIARGSIHFHQLAQTRFQNEPEKLDFELTPQTNIDADRFYLYLFITTIDGRLSFDAKLVKPGLKHDHEVQLSCVGVSDADSKMIIVRDACNTLAMVKRSDAAISDNSLVCITIPVYFKPGQLPRRQASIFDQFLPQSQRPMLMKFAGGGVERKALNYKMSLKLLIGNGGEFLGYGEPQLAVHSLLGEHLDLGKQVAKGSQFVVQQLDRCVHRALSFPQYPLLPVYAGIKLVPNSKEEAIDPMSLELFYKELILSRDKPKCFESVGIEDMSSSCVSTVYIFEAEHRYLIGKDGCCKVQRKLNESWGGRSEFDYNDTLELNPSDSQSHYLLYFSMMMYLVFTGHNPPLAMYEKCMQARAQYFQSETLSMEGITRLMATTELPLTDDVLNRVIGANYQLVECASSAQEKISPGQRPL